MMQQVLSDLHSSNQLSYRGSLPPTVRLAEAVLVLRASEPSWLEVRTLAGEGLFEGTLEGEKRFPLGRGLEVMAGRPYAVTASLGDRPAEPLGKVDEIVWRRFLTPKTIPSPPATPAPAPPAPAP